MRRKILFVLKTFNISVEYNVDKGNIDFNKPAMRRVFLRIESRYEIQLEKIMFKLKRK